DAVFAGDHDLSRGEILESAIILAVYILGEVDLPAQSEIDGELRRDLPCVLHVGEEALLPLGSFGRIADVAGKGLHLPDEECRQAGATASRAGGRRRIKRKLAGAMRIARYAQVLLEADVNSEFQGVVADSVSRVADPLKLVLLFVERTVALVDAKRVSEI